MRIKIQFFGGRGAGSGISKYYLPKHPYVSKKLKDVTHPKKRENTRYRNYYDSQRNIEIEFHPKQTGKNGWQGIDHYHVKNPNSSGSHDYYLDKDGMPCARGSSKSHLPPGEYKNLLRSWNYE